ncbi:uncharacterized protein LOC134788113, partial [Penaeus indicus]|uniref:uncharacterized protein LOC134788113 n=1 Tax=Penaeus indicus TaxID=29960 RepID=UPI00300CD4F8
ILCCDCPAIMYQTLIKVVIHFITGPPEFLWTSSVLVATSSFHFLLFFTCRLGFDWRAFWPTSTNPGVQQLNFAVFILNFRYFDRLDELIELVYLPTVKHNGNLTLDQMIDIARTMRPRSQAKALSGTLKEVLGSAQSVGCTVEGQNPHDIIEGINDGSVEVPEE